MFKTLIHTDEKQGLEEHQTNSAGDFLSMVFSYSMNITMRASMAAVTQMYLDKIELGHAPRIDVTGPNSTGTQKLTWMKLQSLTWQPLIDC